jgi:L-aminopeptidase/D-esterase-like protein
MIRTPSSNRVQVTVLESYPSGPPRSGPSGVGRGAAAARSGGGGSGSGSSVLVVLGLALALAVIGLIYLHRLQQVMEADADDQGFEGFN